MNQPTIESRFGRESTAQQVLAGMDLAGKLAIITGGAGGIGAATALALAQAGADVVIGARSEAKREIATARLLGEARSSKIYGYELDLMTLESVDLFADAVLALGRPVDILINNAAIIGPLRRNALGIESGLMTNFLAHAALTSRLSHALLAAESARLVSLSSFGHHYSDFDQDDPNFEQRPYSSWASYGQSKTGCIHLAVKVSTALKGKGVDAFAVHPGAIMTELGRDMTTEDYEVAAGHNFIPQQDEFVTAEQGAATSIWAATEPQLRGSGPLYLEGCAVAPIVADPKTQYGVMAYGLDPERAEASWAAAERLLGRPLPL